MNPSTPNHRIQNVIPSAPKKNNNNNDNINITNINVALMQEKFINKLNIASMLNQKL